MTFKTRTWANRPSAQRPYTVAVAMPSCSATCLTESKGSPAPPSHRDKVVAASLVIGGAIAGGLAGRWAAHRLAVSPGARGPLTAAALAPVYLTAIVMTFD